MRTNRAISFAAILCAIMLLLSSVARGDSSVWNCPQCKREGNIGNFCGGCGHPAPWKEQPATSAEKLDAAPFKKVGGYVTFGRYPQTAEGNDETPIEWLVLDYDATNHRALLLSRYGLDSRPYNEKRANITWEDCTLRTWLNETFMSKAFTANEQMGIMMTNVDNSSNQGYWSTSGGSNTKDKIFLLSYAEANKYLELTHYSNNTKSCVAPTAYAQKQGAFTSQINTTGGQGTGWWWLRSPGGSRSGAASVSSDGSLRSSRVSSDSGCVRPALWINLESDIF